MKITKKIFLWVSFYAGLAWSIWGYILASRQYDVEFGMQFSFTNYLAGSGFVALLLPVAWSLFFYLELYYVMAGSILSFITVLFYSFSGGKDIEGLVMPITLALGFMFGVVIEAIVHIIKGFRHRTISIDLNRPVFASSSPTNTLVGSAFLPLSPANIVFRHWKGIILGAIIIISIYIHDAQILGRWPFERSQTEQIQIARLLNNLNSGKPSKVSMALDNLGKLLGNSADLSIVEKAIEKAQDSNMKVRFNAIRALANFKNDKATDVLLNILKNDGDDISRIEAARAMGEIGGEKAILGLIQILNDEHDEYIAEKAARALVVIGDPRAIAPMENLYSRTSDTSLKASLRQEINTLSNQR